ncbi:hypothetical protein BDQ12DRAFT_672984 [Crucibulum laeve]|uniref:Uncharacterized protein n=1 Tax=Crucibulum laeve TaxID=68775 RepID=A0A5C3MSV2_9AGAR|nr:hypothetical protein BDQ12DRAFT_672984 [Crucibulum laeve]
MQSLNSLHELLADAEYIRTGGSHQKHSTILNHLKKWVSKNEALSRERVPPLDFLIYAINQITHPTLETKHYAELLDLLTTVESYRSYAFERAEEALTWHDYYSSQMETDVILLSQDDENMLRTITKQNSIFRKMYVTVISKCCLIDLHSLWITSPLSIADYMVRYNEYFPSQCNYAIHSPLLFHRSLSDQEQKVMVLAARENSSFIRDACEWAQRARNDDQLTEDLFQTDDFTRAFPVCDPKPVKQLIDYYLQHVKHTVHSLKRMLPSVANG